MAQASSIIDPDNAHIEESIRALKSRRNELSPIYRLPVEILCRIFKFSQSRAWRPESSANFSQVSQHWRSSALGAPELWTNIPFNYSRWAKEMLIRSKMAKLTIQTFPSPSVLHPRSIETIRSCLYEMSRVEEIQVTTIPGRILEKIFQDIPKSAPQLRTLFIWASCIGPKFSIHKDFLYDTERLQRVHLINCKISWDSRLLTGLTHLSLEDSPKANSSIIQVLQALQRMPALTYLHLTNSIPDDSEGLFSYAVVDLPCLQGLHISSSVSALTAVLRHITFPSSASLNLTCKENQSTQIDFSSFLSVLATRFLSTLLIRSLGLRVLNGRWQTDGLEFYLWTTPLIQNCFTYPRISQAPSQLALTWPSSQPHSYVNALTCAFDAMSLSFLTCLQISTLDCIDSQTWVKTFGKLPLLERVCVQDSAPNSFLEALVYKTKAAEESKTAYHDVSFPKLRDIHLVGANFKLIANSPTIWVDTLLDHLMERCERNAEVQVLRLEDCYYISSDEVKRLEEVVDVIWDGLEQVKK